MSLASYIEVMIEHAHLRRIDSPDNIKDNSLCKFNPRIGNEKLINKFDATNLQNQQFKKLLHMRSNVMILILRGFSRITHRETGHRKESFTESQRPIRYRCTIEGKGAHRGRGDAHNVSTSDHDVWTYRMATRNDHMGTESGC